MKIKQKKERTKFIFFEKKSCKLICEPPCTVVILDTERERERDRFIYVVHSVFQRSRTDSDTEKLQRQAVDKFLRYDTCRRRTLAISRPGTPLCSYSPPPPSIGGSGNHRYSATNRHLIQE